MCNEKGKRHDNGHRSGGSGELKQLVKMLFSENVEKFLNSIGREDLALKFTTAAVCATVNNDYVSQRDIAVNILSAVFSLDIDIIIDEVDICIGDLGSIDLLFIYWTIKYYISEGWFL